MNIDKIRLLLASYYDGTATGAEVNALKRYFVEAKDIPEDLKIDASIFKALASQEDTVVPDDLEEKIIAATTGAPRRSAFLNWRMAVSVAATLALLVTLGLAFRPERPAEDVPPVIMASTILKTETSRDVAMTVKKPEPVEQEQPRIAVSAKKTKPAKSGYTEITDSAQVVEITSRLFAKLDASFNKAERLVKKTEIAVAIINNPFEAGKLKDELYK